MKKKIVFGGIELQDYYIQYKNGKVSILSEKQTGIKEMSIPKEGKALYPKIKFRHNGTNISADIHRVIAENLIPFPRPESIKKKDWDKTPETVKSIFKSLFFVNHIDHDKYNCHPSNLEWVTPKQNVRAGVIHRRKSA